MDGNVQSDMEETEEQLNVPLEIVVRKGAYISPKLITWRGQFKTNFNGEIFLLVAVLKRRLF